ncbi:IS607 family transposase [Coleofasciculus sp.]|uniref:IS607 family transposase n=1 Tax=Coleofasciculus sp. TaxID=3100458 RepID=UPI0039F912C2
MKLSDYAKKAGISYRTAWRWWKQGNLTGHQLPSGTIIITSEAIDDNLKPDLIACIYARVDSAQNKDNLDRQAERLIRRSKRKTEKIIAELKSHRQ